MLIKHKCVTFSCPMFKSKIRKIPRKIQYGKSPIKWQNQKLKHIKQMVNNCYIADLVQAFSYDDKLSK